MNVKINIDNHTVVRVMLVAIGFILALKFLSLVQQALILVFLALFLAVALNSSVTYLASRITRGSRAMATGIAYVVVLSVIALFLYTLVPPTISETSRFVEDIPEYIDDLEARDDSIGKFVRDNDLDYEIEKIGANLTADLSNRDGPLLSGIERVGLAIFSLLTVLVLAFFMLVEGPAWMKLFWELQPEEEREHRQMLGTKIYHIVTGYVNGQLVIALLASLFSLLMMLLVNYFVETDIPFVLPLAGVVGLFGLIPLVGATLGSTVVIVIALLQSFGAALAMLIFFIVYQQIENNVIQPFVQSRTLDVSPLLVLIAVIFGITLGGLLGGLVAIPAAAIIRLLVIDYYQEHNRKHRKRKKAAKES